MLMVAPVWAQEIGVTLSPILTMNSEQVFSATVMGQRITKELEAKVQELAKENQSIAAGLEAEELALTEQRPDLKPEDFRKLADAFDAKVQKIRAEQDSKQHRLQLLREAERRSFIDAITPILADIARRHGAVVVLERRNVLLSADSIDITQEVIDRIDSRLEAPTTSEPERQKNQTGTAAEDGATGTGSDTQSGTTNGD